jgi:uncharacterized membrane protein
MAAQPIYQQQVYPARYKRLDAVMNRAGAITLKYWALAITVLLGIIVGAALSVPFLTYLGLNEIAKPIFFSLHLICAQIPSHSFYILGHQLGMCARNMGIYSSMFVGGLVFVLSKKRLPGIPWWVWLLMILPMAYDGFTQMFALRESTWELRVLTGALFGFGNMWFALPFIQRTVMQMMDSSGSLQNPALAVQPFVPNPTVQPFAPVQTPAIQPDLETPLPSSHDAVLTGLPEDAREDEDAIQEASTPALPIVSEE